jgi:outer membrane protein assembly factor BamB
MRVLHGFWSRIAVSAVILAAGAAGHASDWPRFHGPNGSGVSPDKAPTAVTWSPKENLKWAVELPGPGSSSPIVIGEKVFVTSWSGYGAGDRSASQDALRRHLTCLDRETGKVIWDKTVEPYLPEDEYGGMFAEHGYASHTPVSDGERVYVFFGKTGALAFDMAGNQLWQTSLGTDSNQMNWGTSSSPILYKDFVIVTAGMESQSIYALDKKTGKQVWQSPGEPSASTWGTPILVDVDGNRTDLVIGVPEEVWGLNPDNGKLRWFCTGMQARSFCSSVVAEGSTVFTLGDQGSGSFAIKAGGKGDVTATNVVWSGRDNNRIGTPAILDHRLYFVSNKVATCVDATTGKRVYQARLGGGTEPVAEDDGGRRPQGGPPGGGRGRGGRGGGGGRGGQDYSSAVAADGKVYFVTRNGECHVYKVGDKFEQLATNRVTDDTEDFSATPAISDGSIWIRSSRKLYCVAQNGLSQ